jgi:hypothetical protein
MLSRSRGLRYAGELKAPDQRLMTKYEYTNIHILSISWRTISRLQADFYVPRWLLAGSDSRELVFVLY